MFLDTLHSWDDLKMRAQKENKFIYLFCRSQGSNANGHTLETEFFPQSIKKFLLKHFILLNIEVDYRRKDEYLSTYAKPQFVDSLKEREYIQHTIHIIYDKYGNPLAKNFCSIPDTAYKITYLKEILRGRNQYYPLLNEYRKGNRKANFIKEFYRAYGCAVFFAVEDTVQILEEFIKAYPGKSLFTKANGKLIYEKASDEVMLYDVCSRNLFLNRKEWYNILGKQKVDNKIIEQLSEDLYFIATFEVRLVDKLKCWEKAKEKYFNERKEYSEYDSIVLAKTTTYYFNKENIANKFIESLPNYIKYCFSTDEKIENINNYTWQIFQTINDKALLQQTLKWCESKLSKSKNHYYLDTYANLLYKIGNKSKAIIYEKMAIELSKGNERNGNESTLQKMNNNQQTWQ